MPAHKLESLPHTKKTRRSRTRSRNRTRPKYVDGFVFSPLAPVCNAVLDMCVEERKRRFTANELRHFTGKRELTDESIDNAVREHLYSFFDILKSDNGGPTTYVPACHVRICGYYQQALGERGCTKHSCNDLHLCEEQFTSTSGCNGRRCGHLTHSFETKFNMELVLRRTRGIAVFKRLDKFYQIFYTPHPPGHSLRSRSRSNESKRSQRASRSSSHSSDSSSASSSRSGSRSHSRSRSRSRGHSRNSSVTSNTRSSSNSANNFRHRHHTSRHHANNDNNNEQHWQRRHVPEARGRPRSLNERERQHFGPLHNHQPPQHPHHHHHQQQKQYQSQHSQQPSENEVRVRERAASADKSKGLWSDEEESSSLANLLDTKRATMVSSSSLTSVSSASSSEFSTSPNSSRSSSGKSATSAVSSASLTVSTAVASSSSSASNSPTHSAASPREQKRQRHVSNDLVVSVVTEVIAADKSPLLSSEPQDTDNPQTTDEEGPAEVASPEPQPLLEHDGVKDRWTRAHFVSDEPEPNEPIDMSEASADLPDADSVSTTSSTASSSSASSSSSSSSPTASVTQVVLGLVPSNVSNDELVLLISKIAERDESEIRVVRHPALDMCLVEFDSIIDTALFEDNWKKLMMGRDSAKYELIRKSRPSQRPHPYKHKSVGLDSTTLLEKAHRKAAQIAAARALKAIPWPVRPEEDLRFDKLRELVTIMKKRKPYTNYYDITTQYEHRHLQVDISCSKRSRLN